ncbi:MAG: hypothetical protein FJW21_06390 [Acidimicrobiia bacterium]|nr:hypothetical protein [Acidimicrobiia bacterium]
MPHQITKLTPNLIVSNVEQSMAFYRDVLGFTIVTTVPDAPPYVFAIATSGPTEVFFNAPEAAYAEYPAFKQMPIGGTLTLFFEVTEIDAAYAALAPISRRRAWRRSDSMENRTAGEGSWFRGSWFSGAERTTASRNLGTGSA